MILRVPRRRVRFVAVLPLIVLGICLTAVPVFAQQGEYVGSEACADCHDGIAGSMSHSVHGRIADTWYTTEDGACESCHGPGGAHVAEEDPELILGGHSEDGESVSLMCQGCHGNGQFLDWHMSGHANADVGCTSCHSVHAESPRDNLLKAATTDLCYECHAEQQTQFLMPSHHPLREGFMDCADCHNPHTGAWQNVAVLETERDLCLSCHPQHEGPFIFDHSPVEEDCKLCHSPHGAVANNLLVQNEPFLCLQCHQPHFHASIEGIEGSYGPDSFYDTVSNPGDDFIVPDDLTGKVFESTADGFKSSFLTKCTQCHQAVHGSDLPAQSVTGGGRALVR